MIIIAVVLILLAGGAYLVIDKADQSRSQLPVLGTVPEFNFINYDGKEFDRNDLNDKISVVDFIFTRCKGPCPTMSGYMEELYKKYENSDVVQFVSISVDPDYDSLNVLMQYADDHGVTDDRWKFLHSDIESVKNLCEGGFMLAADDLPGAHSTKFVLVDRQGQIRGYYSGTDEASIKILTTNINSLIKELR